MAVQYGHGQIVTTGLAYSIDAADKNSYPGSGTTWFDTSGYANDSTLTNGPTFSSANGGYIAFDGTNDYAPISTFISSITNVWTISCWVNPTTTNTDTSILGTDANGQDNWYGLNGDVFNVFATEIADVNNFRVQATSQPLSTGTWYNLTATMNVNTVNLYINGSFVTGDTKAFTIGSWASTFTIGRRAGLNQRYYNGYLSSMQMYSRVLSAAEITQNFTVQRKRFGI